MFMVFSQSVANNVFPTLMIQLCGLCLLVFPKIGIILHCSSSFWMFDSQRHELLARRAKFCCGRDAGKLSNRLAAQQKFPFLQELWIPRRNRIIFHWTHGGMMGEMIGNVTSSVGKQTLIQVKTGIFTGATHEPKMKASSKVAQCQVFNRTKPHLNIGTIGHVDHGHLVERVFRIWPVTRVGS